MTARPVLADLKRSVSIAMRRFALAGLGGQPHLAGRPLIAGLFSTPSGIGAGARRIFEALEAEGFEPSAFDLTDLIAPDQQRAPAPASMFARPDDGLGPVIVHVNAPETPYALAALGRDRLKARLRVAYWAWEFESLPASWSRELEYYHECWAPSGFTADAIAAARPGIPVRAVGYALAASTPRPEEVTAWRAYLAPNAETLILTAFDVRSSVERKNPAGVVAAFKQAFEGRRDVRLVLKVTSRGWRTDVDAWLDGLAGGDPRIIVLDQTLSDAEMDALFSVADICLSPHRSEGFGFTPAKALMAGAEVVMTGWSGNLDYADLYGVHLIDSTLITAVDSAGVYGAGPGRWADPDINHAARLLRDADKLRNKEGQARRGRISRAAFERFSSAAFLDRLGPVFRRHVSCRD